MTFAHRATSRAASRTRPSSSAPTGGCDWRAHTHTRASANGAQGPAIEPRIREELLKVLDLSQIDFVRPRPPSHARALTRAWRQAPAEDLSQWSLQMRNPLREDFCPFFFDRGSEYGAST